MERTYPQIDVAGILRARLPRLSRFIPGFVVRALARLIRERELNEVLASYWHLPPQEFILSLKHISDPTRLLSIT